MMMRQLLKGGCDSLKTYDKVSVSFGINARSKRCNLYISNCCLSAKHDAESYINSNLCPLISFLSLFPSMRYGIFGR